MYDDSDGFLLIIGFLVFLLIILVLMLIAANSEKPHTIKDSQCIVYQEQIYCVNSSQYEKENHDDN